ncbi:hypothetical protein T07_9787 [Trichinella nelsoni]|uniref:Uncharacterized protein n=1 Tax=Trichinella nelsoni TaxID=6336 RepID=A0A0V0SIJ6_9BILA|nr:hypothetical protein T07_9787 [Trichinella nelsoni]
MNELQNSVEIIFKNFDDNLLMKCDNRNLTFWTLFVLIFLIMAETYESKLHSIRVLHLEIINIRPNELFSFMKVRSKGSHSENLSEFQSHRM